MESRRINVSVKIENAAFLESFKKKHDLKNLDNTVDTILDKLRAGEWKNER